MRRLLFLLMLLPLVSCYVAPRTPVQRLVPFIADEYAPYEGEGTSTITGQAFLKTRGGDVKLGAGNKVWINPVTSYSTEWFERAIMGGERLEEADPRALKQIRYTIADGDGRFSFGGIPAGSYYVACQITWEVPGKYGMERTGGTACTKVSVGPGETANAVVTR